MTARPRRRSNFDNATLRGYFKVCKTHHREQLGVGRSGRSTSTSSTRSVSTPTPSTPARPEPRRASSTSTPSPLGSHVSITEESTANVVNTAVSVSPASNDLGSFVPTANLKIGTRYHDGDVHQPGVRHRRGLQDRGGSVDRDPELPVLGQRWRSVLGARRSVLAPDCGAGGYGHRCGSRQDQLPPRERDGHRSDE